MFTNYSYERVRVSEINASYCDPLLLARNPFLRDSLLLGGATCTGDPLLNDTLEVSGGGERVISKVVPSLVYNTVDQPIFPTTGKRLTISADLAGLGGNTNFYKPTIEAVAFFKQNNRMSIGFRGQYEYVNTFGSSRDLPIFEKLFLGGEYSVRGFDLRTIGPTDCQPGQLPLLGDCTGLVVGGNKSLLFNAEQIITIAGPVRLILFYDAGQVQAGPERQEDGSIKKGVNFSLKDFKTSTGAEIRFFMPVLNVPFRLIFAENLQRSGVFTNQLVPQKAFQFRFAVGTTF
jgi:outer membrane protein insertion porin family